MKGLELNNKNIEPKSISGQMQIKYLVKTLFAGVMVIIPDDEKIITKKIPEVMHKFNLHTYLNSTVFINPAQDSWTRDGVTSKARISATGGPHP